MSKQREMATFPELECSGFSNKKSAPPMLLLLFKKEKGHESNAKEGCQWRKRIVDVDAYLWNCKWWRNCKLVSSFPTRCYDLTIQEGRRKEKLLDIATSYVA